MKKHTLPHWHRGLHAVHFGFLSGLIAFSFLSSIGLSVLSPIWDRQADAAVGSFSAGSFWNAPVPTYTDLHPQSAALVGDIVRQVSQFGATFNKDNGTSPVYIAEPGTPTVAVEPWDCGVGSSAGLAEQWQAVPIPFYAVPSGGANPQMVIHQYGTGTVWEFGYMRKIGAQWQACTGGRTSTASTGVFTAPYGVSASGLAVLGGQLGMQELQTGRINHVVGLNLAQVNGMTWPATQTSGGMDGAPPMGLRLRLDPSLSIDSLGLHPVAQSIARAAQTYGFIVWNTPGVVGVSAENPISVTARGLPDPYSSLLRGSSQYDVLAGFPWDRLQALPQTTAHTAPLPTIHSFTAAQTTVSRDGTTTLAWRTSNVNRCAIPGIADNLPASGTTITPRMREPTTFVLRCGGPVGTASSQVTIGLAVTSANDAPSQLDAAIAFPYSGYANIINELMSEEMAARAYKVVYYEEAVYLYETATPPFALNTERMDNGTHAVTAKIYFRDGGSDQKTVKIMVQNSPETLFATTQSGVVVAPKSIPPLWAATGIIIVIASMVIGTRWGWHRSHQV